MLIKQLNRRARANIVVQLTQACAGLIEDKDLGERLGRASREAVKEKPEPETMVDIIERVYQKLLQK